MACGTPCVATQVGDTAALLGPGGIVVPPGDAGQLAAAIERAATRVGQPHPYADELCALFSADAVAERLCEELSIGSASRQPSRQP